jgi:GH15 family glucan-1,4-alpha-glucosidase
LKIVSQRLEDYAMIGDCATAALVSRGGSIDWLCLPRFDSSTCFAALLGEPRHGRWLIAPVDPAARATRHYRGASLVLETLFETADGAVAVIDFMRPCSEMPILVRLVQGRRGTVAMRTEFILRFDYGSSVPWVERLKEGGLSAIGGPDRVILRTPAPLRGRDFRTLGEFPVQAGQTVPFVMSYRASHLPPAPVIDPEEALRDTEAFWQDWSETCAAAGEWSEAVKSSLVVLKGLTYQPTGGIVAAPTASLPEQLGGVRNWDYRYCWLRDATFTLLALMHAGYYDEARAWRDWLLRTVAGSPDQLQVLYGIAGERRLTEWEVSWLPGYEGSRPVRVGNAAEHQLQLDIYGEVIDAQSHAVSHGLPAVRRGSAIAEKMLDHLAAIWKEPDEGIWEVRGPRQHFTHSKVMAWVAFDRGIKMFEELHLEAPLARWRRLRDQIHADICEKAYDPTLGSFVQAYGSKALDANLLLLPLVGFLPPNDQRIRGTLAAIERHLLWDGFVLRYDTGTGTDGLPAGEGAFLACSFWLADNLIIQDRVAEGRELFERLLALRNDVGLLAEEYDPRLGRQVGNFPQAFSHVALVNTAFNLSAHRGPAKQRAGHSGVKTAT